MTCEDLHKLLHDFVGNELVIESRTTLEIHIAGCPHCGVLVQSYTHVVRIARALPKTRPLSAAFEARLRAMIEPELNNE